MKNEEQDPLDWPARGVEALHHAAGRGSADVRRAFGVRSFVLDWLPLLVVGAPARMSRLPIAARVHDFERLEEHSA